MTKENIAIILAVSDYGPTNSLPGCKNDGALVRQILEKTGRFAPDNTLYIEADTTSGSVKSALSRFIGSFKGKTIGEVFYYYTGHGLFDGNDFYYLLTDYSPGRTQATTLANAELDEMLRSLGADLAVKVVDACYSAQQYVKSPDEFEKAIKATSSSYNSCYFMYSSEQTQVSWQDSNLSYFTLEFAKSIQQHSSPSIRYKDIIDFVSDSFASNARQRPVFVAQASFTEEFSTVDDAMRQMISQLLPAAVPSIVPSKASTTALSVNEELKERIRKEAEIYCTPEDAVGTFTSIKEVIERYQLPDPLKGLYTLNRTFMVEQYEVPAAKSIGEWLDKNPGEFFAKVLYTSEAYEEEQRYYPRRNVFSASLYPEYPEFRTVTKSRSVISGFDSTEKLPFKAVHLVAEPNLQNLPWWKWYCAFVVSKTDIRCFVTRVKLKEINWEERQQQGKIEWQIRTFPLKDANVAKNNVGGMLDQFAGEMTRFLMEKYGLTEKDDAESPGAAT